MVNGRIPLNEKFYIIYLCNSILFHLKMLRIFRLLVLSCCCTAGSFANENPAIQVFEINDHITAFYTINEVTRNTVGQSASWVDIGAMNLGIAAYAVSHADQAVVYDTLTTIDQAQWMRAYLERNGISQFTVVLSHWHLDHVAGNEVFADSEIISSALTRDALLKNKKQIEQGTLWGPPAINPLILPDRTFTNKLVLHQGPYKLELHNVNIHSMDTTLLYIGEDRILLAGDALEDPITYIGEVEHLVDHINQLGQLKEMEISRILPNHGDPAVIEHGGYEITLIDATIDYLSKLLSRAHDNDYLGGHIEDYIDDSVSKGWIRYFEPYREVHEHNLKTVHQYYKTRRLPDLTNESIYLRR